MNTGLTWSKVAMIAVLLLAFSAFLSLSTITIREAAPRTVRLSCYNSDGWMYCSCEMPEGNAYSTYCERWIRDTVGAGVVE